MLNIGIFKMLATLLLALLILFTSACQPMETQSTESQVDTLFDKNAILDVDINMEPASFEQMAAENRFSSRPLTEAELWAKVAELRRNTEPIPNYFNWYSADISMNGEAFSTVGIRRKGFVASDFYPVPGIKLRLDKYVPNQQYQGKTYITLNNASTDYSRFRTCLTYELFAAADYPAPLCSLAKVDLNGEPLDIYVNVEPIKEAFLKRNFGNDTGSLYEGTGQADLEHAYVSRFEIKTESTDPQKRQLMDLMDALNSPDDELIENLSEHLNIDMFIRFWALEMITGHFDGYSSNENNFYIYFNPDDENRAVFIPWGVDATFIPQEYFPMFNSYHYLLSKIPSRLADNPEIKQQMIDEVHFILEEVWDEEAILESINSYESLILENEEYYTPSPFGGGISREAAFLRTYIEARPDEVLEQLEPMFDLPRVVPGTRRPAAQTAPASGFPSTLTGTLMDPNSYIWDYLPAITMIALTLLFLGLMKCFKRKY
jgi:spore coat protein H